MRPGRRWLELSARRPSDGADGALLAEGLLALGGRAVEERDGWYVTHLEAPADLPRFLARARSTLQELCGGSALRLEHRLQAHEDWAERWRHGLATRRISPRLVVTPTWIPYRPAPGEEVLVLDPGVAFGTAEHGTTRGCLRLLDRAVEEGQVVLDVGAGSGILSIAAALLGAGAVKAVEGDPLACEALEANLVQNGVEGRVRLTPRWADAETLASLGPAEGVVANIEWAFLRPLVPAFAGALAPGGWMILSGILEQEMDEVRAVVVSLGRRVEAVDVDGEWRSLLLGDRSGPPSAGRPDGLTPPTS